MGEEFRQSGEASTTQGLVGNFNAADDFEKELNDLIEASGTAEKDLNQSNALPMNKVIRDEKQIRQVAKLKSLMLREQQTNKRLKKIKSKTYRRIHRKGEAKDREALLERLETENPELAKALKLEYEKKHAQLRMMRQKNARRKWAATMQRFAKGERGAQQEITKQAQKHHDEERALRRAVRGTGDQSSDSEAVDLSGSDNEGEGVRKQTINNAKKLTTDELKNLESTGELPSTGMFGLSFMRDAIKRKREAAKADAKSVLKELEGLDQKLDADADGSDDEKNSDDDVVTPKSSPPARVGKRADKVFTAEELAEAHKDVDAILDRDDMATECTVSGPLTVRSVAPSMVGRGKNAKQTQKSKGDVAVPAADTAAPKVPASVVDNPWLQEEETEQNDEPASTEAVSTLATQVKAAAARGNLDATKPLKDRKTKQVSKKTRKRKGPAAEAEDDGAADDESEGKEAAATAEDVLSVLNIESEEARQQRDLVRTAFVQGTQEEDFEEDVDREEREKEEKNRPPDLVGWGSWTGEGVTPRKPKGKGKGKGGGKGDSAPDSTDKKKGFNRVQFLEGASAANGKYFVDKVPFPFQSPAQYNQEMKMPSGPEWNTLDTHLQRIKPKVCVRAGAVVPPLAYVKHLDPEKREGVIEAWAATKHPKKLKARF
jgi:U3 small nucleolar RNA-associated protein 14